MCALTPSPHGRPLRTARGTRRVGEPGCDQGAKRSLWWRQALFVVGGLLHRVCPGRDRPGIASAGVRARRVSVAHPMRLGGRNPHAKKGRRRHATANRRVSAPRSAVCRHAWALGHHGVSALLRSSCHAGAWRASQRSVRPHAHIEWGDRHAAAWSRVTRPRARAPPTCPRHGAPRVWGRVPHTRCQPGWHASERVPADAAHRLGHRVHAGGIGRLHLPRAPPQRRKAM